MDVFWDGMYLCTKDFDYVTTSNFGPPKQNQTVYICSLFHDAILGMGEGVVPNLGREAYLQGGGGGGRVL